MSSGELNVINVMLTGQPDETNTCFNAVEVAFNMSGPPGGRLVKKPNGFEGVVYTKHPVDLKYAFNKRSFWAEVNEGPQSVYYIYPPGEAVNFNELIKHLSPLIKQEFPDAKSIYHFTQRYASFPQAPDCTYLKEFSSRLAADENNKVFDDRSCYRPGNVIDIVFNREGKTHYTSIFVGVGIIKYRLAILGTFIPSEELKGKLNGQINRHENDRVVEEGEIKPGPDQVADAAKIVKWMKVLVGGV